jgi:hypothetical protein
MHTLERVHNADLWFAHNLCQTLGSNKECFDCNMWRWIEKTSKEPQEEKISTVEELDKVMILPYSF